VTGQTGLDDLRLDLLDFDSVGPRNWRGRRAFIGFVLITYYTLSTAAITSMLTTLESGEPSTALAAIASILRASKPDGESESLAAQAATDTDAAVEAQDLAQPDPEVPPAQKLPAVQIDEGDPPLEDADNKMAGIAGRSIAVDRGKLDTERAISAATRILYQLGITGVFGFAGGLFFVTRTFTRTSVTDSSKIDCPVFWYLLRPAQGMFMAFFVYLAFLAGQLIFYSGGGSAADPSAINIYVVAFLALLGGMFEEHAYFRLKAMARSMFSVPSKPVAPGTP
jgi:hypothetical protein